MNIALVSDNCYTCTILQVQKTCFGILRRLVEAWGAFLMIANIKLYNHCVFFV